MILILTIFTFIFWFLFYFYYQFLILYHIYIFFFFCIFFITSLVYYNISIFSLLLWKYFFFCFFWNICFIVLYFYFSILYHDFFFFLSYIELQLYLNSLEFSDIIHSGWFFAFIKSKNTKKFFSFYFLFLFIFFFLYCINLFFYFSHFFSFFLFFNFLIAVVQLIRGDIDDKKTDYYFTLIIIYWAFTTIRLGFFYIFFYNRFCVFNLIELKTYFISATAFWVFVINSLTQLYTYLLYFPWSFLWLQDCSYLFYNSYGAQWIHFFSFIKVFGFLLFTLKNVVCKVVHISVTFLNHLFLPYWFVELISLYDANFTIYTFVFNVLIFCILSCKALLKLFLILDFFLMVLYDACFSLFDLTMLVLDIIILALKYFTSVFIDLKSYFYPFWTLLSPLFKTVPKKKDESDEDD